MPEIQYTLSLKDRLTSNLQTADHAAGHFDGTMANVERRIVRVAEGFGVSFGLWKGFEFLQSSIEKYDALEQAQSQVEAGLKSTGHAAGVTAEELKGYADELQKHVKYNVDEIQDLQSQVLTFPAVNKANFERTTETILDMATRMHRDKNEIAIAIGKALQDPEHQIANMRRYGVNFNDAQTKAIKHLAATGHIAEAQMKILNELNVEFGGSARAAFDADPLAQYNKALYNLEIGLGQVGTELLREATPYLIEFTNKALELVHWLKENKDGIKSIVKALGAAYIAFKAGSLITASYTALMEGLAGAEATAATATEGMAAASTAALGPIGLIAAAIGGLAYVYSELANNAKIAEDQINKMAAANGNGEKETIASLIQAKKLQFGQLGDKEATGMVAYEETARLSKEVAQKQKEVDELKKQFDNAGMMDDAAAIGGKLGNRMSELETLKAQLKVAQSYGSSPSTVKSAAGVVAAPGTKSQTANAKGNKNETINIHIGSLIKDFAINTTNMKESAGKIQEMVTQVLMNAVNNSQLIANH